MTDPYVTADELGRYMPGVLATGQTDALQRSVEAATKEINGHCGRIFAPDAESSLRRFYADQVRNRGQLVSIVDIDDAWEIASVQTDDNDDGTAETTWLTSDYQSEPLNGVVNGIDGWPVTRLVELTTRAFPTRTRRPGVHVTAKWGWEAIPEPVTQATLRVAHWHFVAPNAPMGVQGFNEFGAVRMPADEFRFVTSLLGPFCRVGGTGLPVVA